MELLFLFACVMFFVACLGVAGSAWLKTHRPDWFEHCQQCQEAATEKCKGALVKAKATAQSWFGRTGA